MPVFCRSLEVRAARLDDQGTMQIKGGLGADVLNAPLPMLPEVIKAQAILGRINQVSQALFQKCPLRGINLNFKDGILHALTIVTTRLGDPPQTLVP